MTDKLTMIGEFDDTLLQKDLAFWKGRVAKLNREAHTVKLEVQKLEVRFFQLANGLMSLGSSITQFLPAAVRPIAAAIVSTITTSIYAAQTIAASSSAMGPIGWLQAGLAVASIAIAAYGLATAIVMQGEIDEDLARFSRHMNSMTNSLSQIMASFRF